ncbi:MAG: type II toxin-antitoxin system RelE/ParE family toxin [Deltaproteobacteria bacterium]|nr:type II toxin-antitoxin system RelE/ParE family toxin [Deltaproteobacteria bacterium]
MRTVFATRIARSVYFYQKGAKIILTHGFIKKRRKHLERRLNEQKGFDLSITKERRKYDQLRATFSSSDARPAVCQCLL